MVDSDNFNMVDNDNLNQPTLSTRDGKGEVIQTAARTALWMAILGLGSKLLGFVRELALATSFGTSYVVDAYVMAQSIPGILFSGVFVAIATAYMPLFSEKVEKEGQVEGNRFTSQILIVFFLAATLIFVIGLIFAPSIVAIFATGFSGETAKLTTFFVRITFSYAFFSGVSILEAYLQYGRIFIPQIFAQYGYNVVVILGIAISAITSEYFLAFGMLLASATRLFFVWLLAKKKGFKFSVQAGEIGKVGKRIAALSLPVFIGTYIGNISVFVDKYLASMLPEGSVAALNYAHTLNHMIMGFSVTVLITLIYPRLSKMAVLNQLDEFNKALQKGFNLIFIIALPFSLGAMAYSDEIVQIIFERGAFDPSATVFTGSPYFYYSIGLLFLSLNTLLLQVYYTQQDTKTPMIFAVISVIIDIILNLILVKIMAHAGLALSTSIGAMVNTVLLYAGLKYKYPEIKAVQSGNKLIKLILASFISVGASLLLYKLVIIPFIAPIIIMRMVQVGLAVGFAVVIYLGLLWAMKVEELSVVKEIFRR